MHIVDAHHHLWDLDAVRYPWLMARGVRRFFGDPTPIQKNYLVSDLRADAGDYVIDASVHTQVGVAPGCSKPRSATAYRARSSRSSSWRSRTPWMSSHGTWRIRGCVACGRSSAARTKRMP